MARYVFADRWKVPLPPEDVYDLLAEPLRYPDWWRSFCLAAEGDAGPPRVGQSATLLTKGFLPYRLTFTVTATALQRPARLCSRLQGHLRGAGDWRLWAVPGGTEGVLHLDVELGKPLERMLSPLLRPLFAANHHWCMRRGEEEAARLGPMALHGLAARAAAPA